MAKMFLSPDWLLDGAGSAKLGLSCAFCTGGDLIYIFSAKPFAEGAKPASMLPRELQELLLFEPIVPLRYTVAGFQALLSTEWEDMSAAKDLYIGLQTRSSAMQSAASQDGDEPADAFEAAEDSASSNADGQDIVELENPLDDAEDTDGAEYLSEVSGVQTDVDVGLEVAF